MKPLTQVVLPIAIVVALVGGITFVLHYRNSPVPAARNPETQDSASTGPRLIFQKGLLGKPLDTEAIAEFEVGTPGTLDFLVLNPTADVFKLGVEPRSGSCKQVLAGVLSPKEWAEFGTAKAAAACQFLDQKSKWQPVTAEPKVAVPPGAPDLPAAMILRFTCQASEPGQERVTGKVLVEQGFARSKESLGARVRFVPPFMVDPAEVRFRPLTSEGQKETAEFFCWSASRPRFDLKAREETGDPSFECVATPLTATELQALAGRTNSAALAGYRVKVQVAPQQGARPFDLGLFTRWIELKSDASSRPLRVKVAGVVRGELALEAPGNLDWIDFGEFAAARGASKTAYLEADQPQPDLKVVSCQPAFLKWDFKPVDKDASTRWELRVRVPPRALKGRIPTGSGIMVEMKGGRKMWIPITGQATQ